MASTYHYRVLKSSWWIAIDLTADVIADPIGAQYVADNLYLRVEVPILREDEPAYLVQGLLLVAEKLQAFATPDVPFVVRVLALGFSECDYQPKGLVCAMAGWAAQEYGFEPPDIQVSFDREANQYKFDFPMSEQKLPKAAHSSP